MQCAICASDCSGSTTNLRKGEEPHMHMKRKWIFLAPLGILALALFVFIGGEVVKQLWNWLLPALFDLPRVTFWQALGLLSLSRILFGGFDGHPRQFHYD